MTASGNPAPDRARDTRERATEILARVDERDGEV